MEQLFKFNHEAEKTNHALGITDELDRKCVDIIFFSTVSNQLLIEDLFEDRSDAPRSLNTMSGDLEKALSLCTNELERSYMLFNFKQTHDLALEALAKFDLLNKADSKEQTKLKLMMKLLDLKVDELAEEIGADHLRMMPSDLFKKIDLIKKSKHDFNKYLSLVNSNDIDSLLGKVFDDE